MNRPEKAGRHLAESIIEMTNLMYQDNTALSFLRELVDTLTIELAKRMEEKRKRINEQKTGEREV